MNKINGMTVTVIIPVLNEAGSIGAVLEAIPAWIGARVVVVDGGSSDGTAEIASQHGATVLLESRRGYGYACAAGLAKAQSDLVAFMDGDAADDPDDIPRLLEPFSDQHVDMVLGSRLAKKLDPGVMPVHQQLGNRFSAALINRLYHKNFTDLSPMRAVKRDRLLLLGLKEMTYGWPTEMIVKALRENWRVVEVSVSNRPRSAGDSKISGTLKGTVLATYHILFTILRYSIGVKG